jgi:hypothetical protein
MSSWLPRWRTSRLALQQCQCACRGSLPATWPSLTTRHSRPPGPIVNRPRLLFPIRPHVNPIVPSTALRALYLGSEPRDWGIARIARHVDDGLAPTGIVEAECDQGTHALPTHVGEVHRRAGWASWLGHSTLDLPSRSLTPPIG